MTLKLSVYVFRALSLSFKQGLSLAIDASRQKGRQTFAAAGLCALLMLGGFAPAHAQVTYAGVQTMLGSGFSADRAAVDGAGDVFIADFDNNRVVELPAGGGAQTTVGTGLYEPTGVAVDGAGDLFIADYGDSRIVEVPAGGGTQITVVSGLNSPTGVAVDGAGDVFIAEFEFNGLVVEVPAGGGALTTVASGLDYPFGVGWMQRAMSLSRTSLTTRWWRFQPVAALRPRWTAA